MPAAKKEDDFDTMVDNIGKDFGADSVDKDLFDDKNEAKQKFVNWKKLGIGATISGYYVDHRVTPNRMKAGTDQALYVIMQKNGEVVIVAGRYGEPKATFPGIEQAPLGSFVGFKFEGERPSTKKGYSPLMIIRTFIKKGKDGTPVVYPEAIAKYKGESMESADEAE